MATLVEVSLTQAGGAVDWPYGWALVLPGSDASTLALEFSVDGGTTYFNAIDGNQTAISVSSSDDPKFAFLPARCKVKVTGTGGLSLFPGIAPIEKYAGV